MTVMTAPPSDKAAIVDVKFAHRAGRAPQPRWPLYRCATDVDSPWVPFGDGAAIKHLAFDVRQNLFSNILWVKGPA
jgi:hypothetical protein